MYNCYWFNDHGMPKRSPAISMKQSPQHGRPQSSQSPIDDNFDVELANKLARLESYNKHLYRPNTYLHKWWARRCGSTFRLLLKHLAEDESSRDYYAPGGLEGKIVLDPMMGGGTTLHEAVRLGANVIGVDLDPIPILQARATLGDVPLETLEVAFERFHERLSARLNGYFGMRARQRARCQCVFHGNWQNLHTRPSHQIRQVLGNITGLSDFVLIQPHKIRIFAGKTE